MGHAPLTPTQKRFTEWYRGNGVEAARRAGYTGNANTLASIASENLRKPNVMTALEEKEKRRLGKAIATTDECLATLTDMMRDERKDGNVRAKCAQIILQSNGALINRVEHSGKEGAPIKIDLTGMSLKDLLALGGLKGVPENGYRTGLPAVKQN